MEITTEYSRGECGAGGEIWTSYPEIILKLKSWSEKNTHMFSKKHPADLTIA